MTSRRLNRGARGNQSSHDASHDEARSRGVATTRFGPRGDWVAPGRAPISSGYLEIDYDPTWNARSFSSDLRIEPRHHDCGGGEDLGQKSDLPQHFLAFSARISKIGPNAETASILPDIDKESQQTDTSFPLARPCGPPELNCPVVTPVDTGADGWLSSVSGPLVTRREETGAGCHFASTAWQRRRPETPLRSIYFGDLIRIAGEYFPRNVDATTSASDDHATRPPFVDE